MAGNTEELIELTGGCGIFQLFHVISTHLCRIVGIWGLNMMTFGSYNPGWSCSDWAPGKDMPLSSFNKWTTNHNHSPESYYYVDDNKLSNCSISSQCSSLHFDPKSKTIVTEWKLICDQSWVPSFVTSIQMLGQLLGCACAGCFAENMGRRICLYSNVLLFALANLIAAYSSSWHMFIFMRFFIGFGCGGIIPTAFIYTMEFLNAKWRGIVGGLPIINVGLLVFSVMVYFERDWRMVQISTAVFSFVALLSYFWISESMRWLAVHDRKEEAKQIVSRIATYNSTSIPAMNTIDSIAEAEFKRNNSNSKIYSYLDLFKDHESRMTNIKLVCLWFFEVISFFSLTYLIGSLPGDFYINFILFSAWEVVAVSLTGFIVNWIGRVKAGACYFGLAGLACVAALITSVTCLSSEYPLSLIILPMTAKGLLGGGRAIVKICTSELIPTNTRALGFSFHLIASRAGAILAPFLVPGQIFTLDAVFLILAVLQALSTCIFLILPETKDKMMSDLIEYSFTIEEPVARVHSADQRSQRWDNTMASHEQIEEIETQNLEMDIDEKRKIIQSSSKSYTN